MITARFVGRAAAALALLLVLALLLQPWWLAPLASHLLSSSARRPVHVDSMWFTLSRTLAPVAQFRGIRIDNAAWADKRRPFAVLAAATAVFSWRSLDERRPVIALLVLSDGEVDLERRADGLRNWRLGQPEDRGPGRYKVLAIRGEDATVRFLHEGLELDFEAKARPDRDAAVGAGNGAGEPMPTRLDVSGTWRGAPFVVAAKTGEVLTFVETGTMFRVRGHLASGGARLDLDGHLGDIVRDPRVDAHVVLDLPSLVPLAAVLGAHRREAKAIAVEGDLKGEPGRYALSAAKGHVGATDLAGELSWARGDDRDLVRARLKSESAHLADLRSLAGPRAPKAIAPGAASASAPASAAAATPPSPPARPLDAELSYAARRLHVDGMPWLRGAALDASFVDGRLAVSRFDVGIGSGHAVGKASVDTRARPTRGDLEADVSAIRIEPFLPAKAAKSLLSGTLHGRAVLKASGDSGDALLASAAGTVSAFVTGGTISSLLDADMGLQGGRIVRSALAGAEPIAVRCATAIVDVDHGAGRIRALAIDTERTRTTGSGTVDLARQSVDVVLTPQAKQAGLFILDRSIRLHGALREPKHELVPRAAAASAPANGCRPDRP